jgi:hypothetical protein
LNFGLFQSLLHRVDGGTRDRQFIPIIYHNLFALALFRSNRPLWLPKSDAGSSAIFCNELNSGFFEGAPHIFKRTRIWLPCSAFKVRNGLRGCFACL